MNSIPPAVVVTLAIAISVSVFLFNKYRTRTWRTVLSGWPLVPATVEQVILHVGPDNMILPMKLLGAYSWWSRWYRVEIIYSYLVDGEYYSGWYDGDFVWSEVEADDFVAQYPKGTTIKVHVSPAKPELSVLRLQR